MNKWCYYMFAVALVAGPSLAFAAGWGHYSNARFQYAIDIPPGFSAVSEAENGDGGATVSADGRVKLLVWGSYLADRNFAAEIRWRVDQDRGDSWTITYQKQTKAWAVWSGARGNRIVYERAIAGCDDEAAYFRLEYDKDQAKASDPIVSRLNASLRKGDC